MNKFKQCTYTLILLFTCLIASPKIYKQIWDTSKEKKKAESYKPPAIELPTPDPAQPQNPDTPQPTGEDRQPEATGTDTPAVTTDNEPGQATEPSEAASKNNDADSYYVVKSDPSYFDDALFIGDSRTVGIRDYGSLQNASYYCDVGLAASKLDKSAIASAVGGKTFGKIYIMLGINEVGNDFEYTVSRFRTVVDAVREYQPNAVIYLAANLHVTAAAQQAGITNERIDYLNGRIKEFADNKSIFYIDVNPVFDDGAGNLNPDITGDGIHVFASYYNTWCDWLCMNTVGSATTHITMTDKDEV